MAEVTVEYEGDPGPSPAEKIEELEARVDAAAALAENANATAQEVADAMKPRQ